MDMVALRMFGCAQSAGLLPKARSIYRPYQKIIKNDCAQEGRCFRRGPSPRAARSIYRPIQKLSQMVCLDEATMCGAGFCGCIDVMT